MNTGIFGTKLDISAGTAGLTITGCGTAVYEHVSAFFDC